MALSIEFLSSLAVLLPLVGSAFWFWLNPKVGEKVTGALATGTVFISFLCTLGIWAQVGNDSSRVQFFSWIWTGGGSLVNFGFQFDALSLALGLVVTGVGSLIHLYASGYMHGDKSFGRFFSYLNLFVFSMLMLIWSDSLLGVFLGWEGVGLCSYLLISFWFSDVENASAGKKAFIVNRVGDFGFLIAMFALFKAFGALGIPEILGAIESGSLTTDQIFWSQIACFGLVLGATGKSAQVPLYVWLPDAMAGPTPVSALIHAATMVTAGIYLICRLQGLFNIHPGILELIAYVGGVTAFFAATIAVFQYDIKKVLAYSTISQLGYMFLAVGLSAPVAAYFHLITHAFFKALLFLGAGSVIHGVHDEQDMRKMGGLKNHMPITFWTMTVGVLAIAGIPPLSGFVSKDEILHVVSEAGRPMLSFFAFATAILTAFYMGRMWVMTFFGKYRGEAKPHESAWSMTSVLVVLAGLSALGGFLNWPEAWGGGASLHHYLDSVVFQKTAELTDAYVAGSIKLAIGSALLGAAGLIGAFFLYRNFNAPGDFLARPWQVFRNKYYVDEIYEFVFVRTLKGWGEFFYRVIDQAIIDGLLNGSAKLSHSLSLRMKRLQTGLTQTYAIWVWLGLILLLAGAWKVG